MNPVTITTRRQVTLSKELLDHLGVQPGNKICFDTLPGGEIRIRAVRPLFNVADFFPAPVRQQPRSISVEELWGAIELGWSND